MPLILACTGSQWSSLSMGEMCDVLLLRVTSLAAEFWRCCRRLSWYSGRLISIWSCRNQVWMRSVSVQPVLLLCGIGTSECVRGCEVGTWQTWQHVICGYWESCLYQQLHQGFFRAYSLLWRPLLNRSSLKKEEKTNLHGPALPGCWAWCAWIRMYQ